MGKIADQLAAEVFCRVGRIKQLWHGCGVIYVLLFLMAGSILSAQETFSVFWENDSRYLKPNGESDRHYTNGLKLVYTAQPKWQWLEEFGDWGSAVQSEDTEKAVGFFLGQNIYTPNHADEPANRKDKERPFAGWLYTGLFVQRREGAMLDHVELNLGVIGPSSRADRTQQCIHEMLNSTNPVGWDDQLGDEPAADFTWVRKQRREEGFLAPTEHTDAIVDFGFTAGSLHRHAEAGIMFRYGGNLPKDFGPGRLSLPSSAASRDIDADKSFYLFTRLSGRVVEHDRFLSGVSPEPFVGQAEAGVVCRFGDFEVAYSQTFLSHEFKQQGPHDSFGALTLTWLF